VDKNEFFAREWALLHRDHERYEWGSHVTKLLCLAVYAWIAGVHPAAPAWFYEHMALLLIALFWLLDAIWKTFQGRLVSRILLCEEALRESEIRPQPFQLYSTWQAARLGLGAMLGEYARSALRPTVAVVYGILMVSVMLRV
jgi:hypothetical protein